MKKVKAVLWTRQNAKNEYPIKLRFFSESERKYKYISINIGLSARKFFNAKEGLVRSSFEGYKEYNAIIIDEIGKLSPEHQSINHDSFMQFLFNYYESLISNGYFGNGKKFKVLHNKLSTFLGGKNLTFNQFDLQFVRDFHLHLKKEGLNDNTIQIYLNKLKRIYNIARHERKIVGENIWEFYKYKGHSTVSKALTDDEYLIFSESRLTDKRLDKIRMEALFLFFANGMRIGDLLLLRWGSIEGSHINYNMRKTKKLMRVYITKPLAHILSRLISEKTDNEGILCAHYEFQLCFIDSYAQKHKNEYVLDYLQGIEFEDELSQYNKVQNITAVWNVLLKEVCDALEIRRISSHVMRHTFSSLLLSKGHADIKIVSQSLGHANIAITNKYIRTLSTPEMDKAAGDFYNGFRINGQDNDCNITDVEVSDKRKNNKQIL